MLKITYHIGYTIGDFLIIESLFFKFFFEFLLTKFCNKDGNVYLNICSQFLQNIEEETKWDIVRMYVCNNKIIMRQYSPG